MPPRSVTSICSAIRAITGADVLSEISVECASLRPEAVTGELDDHHLHAQADPQVRDVVLARDARGGDHALDAALAEAAGHDDAVELADAVRVDLGGHPLGLEPLDDRRRAHGEAGVADRLADREVRVGHRDVLADDADAQRLASCCGPGARPPPRRSGRSGARRGRCPACCTPCVSRPSWCMRDRDVVDARRVDRRDDRARSARRTAARSCA